ncbi:MAG TPA: hypothetical protein VF666_21160 [Pyrinomonadaceae bacterium]
MKPDETTAGRATQKLKASAMCLVLILIPLASPPTAARAQGVSQTTRGAWADVMNVAGGKELVVQLRDGTTAKGRVASVTETKLTLVRKKKNTEIDRADILRVYRVGGRQMAKRALIGLGVGAGAGALIGGVAYKGETESGEAHLPALVFGLVGGGLGALTGLIAGSSKKRMLIYEARLGVQ